MSEEDTHIDIHVGIQEQNLDDKPIVFSVGHRCTTASLIKIMKMKFESYPFDWVVSKLKSVRHFIENDFKDFLNKENYTEIESDTINVIDDVEQSIIREKIVYNHVLEKDCLNNRGSYGYQLALTHHAMANDKDNQYFERCIARIKKVLSSPRKKHYLYVHPLLGFREFCKNCTSLLLDFINFHDFMKTKTKQARGIFFFVVRHQEKNNTIEKVFESETIIVQVLYTNNDLIDAGGVFDGDFYKEQFSILVSIENIIK